jgi:hypothetical protein
VGFGEVAPDGVAWKSDRSALRWRDGIGHEGRSGERRRLGAEHKGLRVRGLAVGSSPLPWARIQLAANLGLVKGLVGPDRDVVCSRGARSAFDPPTRRLGTVAPSAARRLVAGGEGGPAGSTVRPPTVKRNARRRASVTGVAAPSAGRPQKPQQRTPRSRVPRADVQRRRPRASAQATILDFFAATVRGVKSPSRPRSGAHASGSAAHLAVRRCGA